MAKHPPHLLELAKRGAEVQLRALLNEARLLVNNFPHLRESFDRDELPLNFLMAEDSGALGEKGRRRATRKPMSAAAKQVASARMKKYWAEKRNAEQG